MPPLTRWFVKTSFVYFALSLLLGVLLAAQSAWNILPSAAAFFPTYFHLLAEIWISMLIIGVVFWMFPKYSLDRPRRSERTAWASYILLNAGLLLRLFSEPANSLAASPAALWDILLILAAMLQWLGGLAFVVNTWGRVKER